MHARLAAMAIRIDALSLRERGILLGVMLLLVYTACDRLFIAPATANIQQRHTEITALESRLSALQTRAAVLSENGQDPLAERHIRISELEKRLAAQDARFEEQLGRLVRPQQAAPLLRDVLKSSPGLRLLELDSAPGEPLLADGDGEARIIRYDVELRVEGGYLATLDYFRRLEQLPWSLFWDSLDLEVKQYPQGDIRISVHTLGQRP